MPRCTSQNFCCQCPCPHGEPKPPPTSAGYPPTLGGRSGSVFYGVTAPSPWVLICTVLCVCSPRVESLFPPVLSKSCSQIPLAFKYDSVGIPPPVVSPPGCEAWCGAQNLHSNWWTFMVQLFSSLWVTHPAVMGFDFIVTAPLLPSHCSFSFVFGCGISFLVSSRVFLLMIVQQLVVIPVLSWEGVRSPPSTLPSWIILPQIDISEYIFLLVVMQGIFVFWFSSFSPRLFTG